MKASGSALFQSRKFLLLVLDTAISLAALLLPVYFAPDHVELALAFIAIIQPVFVALIASIAWEDAAEKGNQPPAQG